MNRRRVKRGVVAWTSVSKDSAANDWTMNDTDVGRAATAGTSLSI